MEGSARSHHFDSPDFALLNQERFSKQNAGRPVEAVERVRPSVGQDAGVHRALIDDAMCVDAAAEADRQNRRYDERQADMPSESRLLPAYLFRLVEHGFRVGPQLACESSIGLQILIQIVMCCQKTAILDCKRGSR